MHWRRSAAGRRSLVVLAAWLLGAALVWGPSDARAAKQRGRGAMLLFGSSSMKGMLGYVIAKELEQLGFEVTRHGVVSAGLARPDFRDIPQILGKLPIVPRATSVMLYLGANDAKALWLHPHERAARDKTPWLSWRDERWEPMYEARMVDLINSLCARGANHTFVLPPVDVARERLQHRLERVRKAQQRATNASKCGHYVSTTGDRVFEIDGRSLRSRDGVHLSRIGAHLVWSRIRSRVLAVLGHSDRSSATTASL